MQKCIKNAKNPSFSRLFALFFFDFLYGNFRSHLCNFYITISYFKAENLTSYFGIWNKFPDNRQKLLGFLFCEWRKAAYDKVAILTIGL